MTSDQRLETLRGEDGLALVATLMVVVLIAAIVTAAITGGLSNFRAVDTDYRSTRAFYAAEAGAEAALSQIEAALHDGRITDAELSEIQPPPLEGFSFSQFEVEKDDTVYVETISDGAFAGLYALTQRFNVFSRAADPVGANAAVVLGGKAQAIPIFQFGWFHGGNGQFSAGDIMHYYGRVHTNGNLFICPCNTYFHEPLTTAGFMYRDAISYHRPPLGAFRLCAIRAWIDDASATSVFLDFDHMDTPDPEAFKAKTASYFDDRLMTSEHGVDSLKLPLPDGVPPRELIRPRDSDDTEAEKDVKFAWKADMYVTVNLTTLEDYNVACGTPPLPSAPTRLPKITVTRYNGFSAVPSPEDECKIFRFKWEAFFDNREDGWEDVLRVDIGALKDWIELGSGDGAEIVYIEFLNADAVPVEPSITDKHNFGNFQDAFNPSVMLVNGAELPGPLTIGSEYTVYVQGDYNTINWKPAAIFTDLWGQLSNAWDDSHAQTDEDFDYLFCPFQIPECPPASNTEQNHAVITASPNDFYACFHEEPGCSPQPSLPFGEERRYNGGGTMLESWRHRGYSPYGVPACTGPRNACTHKWRGSVVALYPSATTSIYYNSPAAHYYEPPIRDHSFETRFQNPDNLPPGTPLVGQVLRAAFREEY
ncbi:MAG TPA: hypothetical protein VLC48_04780, partial [Gemmatimonadota bacterium]|nr:hypothetical protein [Gemmatimonadota bacterium]